MPVTREVPVEYETDSVVQRRMAAWDLEFRAKYTQSEIDDMGKKGQAFGPDADGHYSYPIADEDDLQSAIKAVGRGNADHDKIRKYIIGRAKDLKADAEIPDNWNSDGSLKQANAKTEACNRCDGSGTVTLNGDEKECPQCGGTGSGANNADKNTLPKSVEWRQQRANTLKGMERRVRFERFELRDNNDGTLHFTGYASVTDTPYDMGFYSESIARGAFKKTLAEQPDVTLLLNHGGLPLARTKAGTLRLDEDGIGLKVDADLDAEDPDSQVLARKMKRGDLDGQMSFAFNATRQVWNEDYTQRNITECNIHRGDVSVVTQGANPTTFSSIRSDDALMALRHAGPLAFVEAITDIRRLAATPKEQRVGATISAATADILTQVLNLTAIADDAVDQAQPLLAALLGVENPDDLDAYGQMDDTACGACGGMNDSDAQYCDQCGAAMTVDDTSDEPDEQDSARGLSLALEARRRMEALRYPKKGAA